MSGGTSTVVLAVGRAVRRLTVRRVLRQGAVGFGIGAGLGLFAAAVDSAFGLLPAGAAWGGGLPAGLGLAGALVGGVAAWLRKSSELAAAGELDGAVAGGGRDVVASAFEFVSRGNAGAFEAATVAEAERLLAGVDVPRAVPLSVRGTGRGMRAWTTPQWAGAGAAVLAAAMAVGLFVPKPWVPVDRMLGRGVVPKTDPKQIAEQLQIAKALAEAAAKQGVAAAGEQPKGGAEGEQGKPGGTARDGASEAVSRQIAAIDQLQRELEGKDGKNGAAPSGGKAGKTGGASTEQAGAAELPPVQRAAKALDEVAAAVQQRAEAAAKAEEKLRENMREAGRDAEAQGGPQQGPGSELLRSLQQGDVDAAREKLDDLERNWANMNEQQRAEVARKLGELGEKLERAAEKPAAPQNGAGQQSQSGQPSGAKPPASEQEARQQTEQQLRDLGVPEEKARELADAAQRGDAAAIRRELEKQGRQSDEAARAAQDAVQRQKDAEQQQQTEEKAKTKTRTLAERLKELSDQMKQKKEQEAAERERERKPEGATPPEQKQGQPGEQKLADGKPGEQRQGEQKTGEQKTGEQSQTGQRPESGQQGQQGKQGQKPDANAEPKPVGGEADKRPSGGREGEQSRPDPNAKPDANSKPQGKPEAGAKPDPNGAPQPKPDANGKPDPNGAPQPKPDANGKPDPNGAPQPKPDANGKPDPSGAPQPKPDANGKPDPNGVPQPKPDANGKPDPNGASQSQPQQQGQPQSQPKPDAGASKPSGFQKLREQLEQASRDRAAPQQAAKDSAALREQARKMLEGMTPQEREEAMKLARELAQGKQTPPTREPRDGTAEDRRQFGTEPAGPKGNAAPSELAAKPSGALDARPGQNQIGRGGPQRTLAEWQGQGGKVAASDQPALQETVRQAADAAQQAIERQQVPRRLEDVVARWYKRLPDALGVPAPAGPATPAAPATPGATAPAAAPNAPSGAAPAGAGNPK